MTGEGGHRGGERDSEEACRLEESKGRVWVEMNPYVVLPAMIEVSDGAWTFTISVTVTVTVPGNEGGGRIQRCELTRCRGEPAKPMKVE